LFVFNTNYKRMHLQIATKLKQKKNKAKHCNVMYMDAM